MSTQNNPPAFAAHFSSLEEADEILAMSSDAGDGRWITIDGAHVFVKGGSIEHGPTHLVGKKIGGHSRLAKALGNHPHTEKAGVKHVEGDAQQIHETLEKNGFHKLTPEHDDYYPKAIKQHEGRDVHQYRDSKTNKIHLIATGEKKTEPTQNMSSPDTFYLHAPGTADFFPALTLGRSDLPSEVAGQPATYMWKDLIHTGEYIHPTKGFKVTANAEKIDVWVKNFALMKSRGVEVPINVDHSETADAARGFLIEAKREGKSIKGLCQFIGEDAARTAARNRVSVGIDERFKDGKGNTYDGGAIRHVALTPMPVVPNQSPFTIAASAAAAGGDVLLLAAAELPKQGNPNMADKTLKCSEETLHTLHGQVPGLAEKNDDDKAGHLAQHVATLHSHIKDLTRAMGREYGLSAADLSASVELVKTLSAAKDATPDETQLNLSRVTTERDELAQERDRLAAEVQTLSRQIPKTLEGESLDAMIEAVHVKLDNAVIRGGINPATRDRFKTLLTKDAKGKVNTLALSRAANPTGNAALALAIADICIDNRPVPLGSQTDIQILSRVAPDAETDEDKAKRAADAKEMFERNLKAK